MNQALSMRGRVARSSTGVSKQFPGREVEKDVRIDYHIPYSSFDSRVIRIYRTGARICRHCENPVHCFSGALPHLTGQSQETSRIVAHLIFSRLSVPIFSRLAARRTK